MSNRLFTTVLTLGVALGLALVVQSPASSAPRSEGVGLASFEGRLIDLKTHWGEAQSCVVFSDTHTECFRDNQEADEALGYHETGAPEAVSDDRQLIFPCAEGWLCLYEDINGLGRRLIFNDEWWHDLTNWGFDRRTSSWRNRQSCSDWGALGDGAGGVLNLDPCARAAQMGPWNDRAVHVFG